jgi:hypothetical protein
MLIVYRQQTLNDKKIINIAFGQVNY